VPARRCARARLMARLEALAAFTEGPASQPAATCARPRAAMGQLQAWMSARHAGAPAMPSATSSPLRGQAGRARLCSARTSIPWSMPASTTAYLGVGWPRSQRWRIWRGRRALDHAVRWAFGGEEACASRPTSHLQRWAGVGARPVRCLRRRGRQSPLSAWPQPEEPMATQRVRRRARRPPIWSWHIEQGPCSTTRAHVRGRTAINGAIRLIVTGAGLPATGTVRWLSPRCAAAGPEMIVAIERLGASRATCAHVGRVMPAGAPNVIPGRVASRSTWPAHRTPCAPAQRELLALLLRDIATRPPASNRDADLPGGPGNHARCPHHRAVREAIAPAAPTWWSSPPVARPRRHDDGQLCPSGMIFLRWQGRHQPQPPPNDHGGGRRRRPCSAPGDAAGAWTSALRKELRWTVGQAKIGPPGRGALEEEWRSCASWCGCRRHPPRDNAPTPSAPLSCGGHGLSVERISHSTRQCERRALPRSTNLIVRGARSGSTIRRSTPTRRGCRRRTGQAALRGPCREGRCTPAGGRRISKSDFAILHFALGGRFERGAAAP